jgi:MscS family membrane protein
MAGNAVGRLAKCLGLTVLAGLLFGFLCAAEAADPNPLSPADTSSPRATLQGFIGTVDDIYAAMTAVFQEYAESNQLYMTA